MESPRLRLLSLLGAALLLMLPLLGVRAQEDADLQPRALDIYSAVEDASHEKELVSIPLAPDPLGLPRCPFLCTHFSSSNLLVPFPESGHRDLGAKRGHPLPFEHRLELTGCRQSVERTPPCLLDLGQYLRQRPLSFCPRTSFVPRVPTHRVRVGPGFLVTRAESEHLGWAHSQGGNFGLWGDVLQIEALQEVLKKLKSKRIPIYEKKYGQVPMCDAGEQCAVRKGARIGKLCDCPRGTSCNSFLLKCL
ncbi:Cocaine- and amphetamine-regulated transcript protein [Sciurus carolinensis]|uniref:Cocaine- and amphetamine-regulated transcript protein n=1 Tax=Sciurus carolinensis TaxID=30640 RepID=A0AA41MVE5_SCICA|nr:Cocaine- and amphetamine-regulated transcript protein [Sciurus carolinensis]